MGAWGRAEPLGGPAAKEARTLATRLEMKPGGSVEKEHGGDQGPKELTKRGQVKKKGTGGCGGLEVSWGCHSAFERKEGQGTDTPKSGTPCWLSGTTPGRHLGTVWNLRSNKKVLMCRFGGHHGAGGRCTPRRPQPKLLWR